MTQLFIRHETVDHLGRVIPAITVDSVTCGYPEPREVQCLLTIAGQYGQWEAHDAIVRWAWAHGVTHGPEDLAGRRSKFTLALARPVEVERKI